MIIKVQERFCRGLTEGTVGMLPFDHFHIFLSPTEIGEIGVIEFSDK